jgi:hypothetical protein
VSEAEDQIKWASEYIQAKYDKGGTLPPGWGTVENKTGEDLVIHAPVAAAQGDASMNSTTEPEEAGDGLD